MAKFNPSPIDALKRKVPGKKTSTEFLIEKLQQEDTKRVHAFIPESLYKKAKLRAIEQNISLKDVLVNALSNYLS